MFITKCRSLICAWCFITVVCIILQSKVWQMTMPLELSLPVQRVLRTMISGVMLVQCFTVYVYLASYIVLLYPVFLVSSIHTIIKDLSNRNLLNLISSVLTNIIYKHMYMYKLNYFMHHLISFYLFMVVESIKV